MRNSTRIAGTSFFVVAICVVTMIMGARPVAVATHQQQNDTRKEKLERLRIQTFSGEAASLRAKELRKQHKGIARAMKDAEKRGLRQAFDKGRVILATDPATTATNPGSVARTSLFPFSTDLMRHISFISPSRQDTFTDGEYEITFMPYDDGDPNTWEGVIYRNGPDIAEDTRYAVIDIQTEDPFATQETYYPSDGGEPQPVDPDNPQPLINAKLAKPLGPIATCNLQSGKPEYAAASIVLSAKRSVQGGCPRGTTPCMRVPGECCSPPPNIRPWLGCAARACGAAAIGCIRSGPAWSVCWGTWCTGGMVFCLF